MSDQEKHEYSEAYWYGPGWPQLRNLIVRECLPYAETLVAKMKDAEQQDYELLSGDIVNADFIAPVIKALDAKIRQQRQAGSNTMRLELALALLAFAGEDVEPTAYREGEPIKFPGLRHRLARHLELNRRRLESDDTQALRDNLERFFNGARRGHRSAPHREATWQRIKAQIRQFPETFDPWSPRHQQQLLATLREQFPNDHNLPRTVEGLLAYVAEFQGHEVDHEHVDIAGVQELEILLDDTADLRITNLYHCLERLHRELADAHEVISTRFRLDGVVHLTLEALKHARGWTQRQINALRQEGMQQLGDCMRERIDAFHPEQD